MQSNTENFLIWGFQKLLQDKEIKKSQNQQLKRCCESLLSELKEKIVENGTSSSVLPAVKSESDNIMSSFKYFEPFELALTSKSQTIVVTALDCLQKLIAYGHVSNTARYKDGKERLVEKMVLYVCECFQNGQSGEGVQLQIIKAILTITNNAELEIHENQLITMVRTCYSIFLACRDAVIQHTAKGTLTQMLNTIFGRMEARTIELLAQTNAEIDTINEETEDTGDSLQSGNEVLVDSSSSGVVTEILDDILTQVEHQTSPTENGICSDHPDSCTEKESGNQQKNFAHIYQKDAFLVFRCLCRLSLKALPDGSPDPRSHDLRSKILSLELLLNILQNAGPVFKQSDVFINAIKQYLCVALSKNGVSSVSEVFELSLSIFLSLLSNFKQHLKRQNEVFFKEIFLYILESPRSSFIHKDLVLEALKRICVNAQCVVDIFLNYDCDMSLANIFERLVNDLAKIAQGRQTGDASTNTQSKQLRIKALDCLYSVLKCMVDWSRELYVSPESQSFFGVEQERHEGVQGSGVAPKIDKRASVATTVSLPLGSTASVSSQASSQSSLVAAVGGVPNNSPQDNPEQFATRKQQKELFEQGISLFNKKPLKGLNFLQGQDLLGTTVEDVAEFLHKDERLNKTVVGDFLGENERYNIEVMYAFVDQFDFCRKDFVSALRDFLAGFRMPGEAQKIDRLMEKFAARYCECNSAEGSTPFRSADTAYVLAYSIIMLTTDLHSAQIKNRYRMRKEDYIRMNRGINESDDLDVDYLGRIYDEIADNEIKMKDALPVERRRPVYNETKQSGGEKQRQLLFNMEVEEMARAAKELMESISHIESDFTSATHHEHVKPMFKLVWTPFLAAFSVGLQDCDDSDISRFCLEGIRCAIRIACIFGMELERNAYIQALSRFTLLITGGITGGAQASGGHSGSSQSLSGQSGVTASGSQIKSKNIETIKTLIHVAHSDGNYLGSSWLEILRCISQLESAQLIGGGTGPPHTRALTAGDGGSLPALISKKVSIFGNVTDTGSKSSGTVTRSDSIQTHLTGTGSISGTNDQKSSGSLLHEVMGETGSQSVIVAVDKVFTGSVRLDGDAIVDFVKALCQVSRDELSLAQPRIFSLQKLVEISYYNMGRIRLQWSRVWLIIGEHFTNAGRSPNEDVAVFAMDSLRQLAVKFIEKGEFPNFHFQKDFLRPFVNVMDDSDPRRARLSHNVEDMVVRCVAQLVQSHWSNIRSGWANVFLVFHRAAAGGIATDNQAVVEMAFDSMSFVVREVFRTSFHLVVDSFQNLVKSLAEFACNTNFPDINMEAIRLLRQCARYVDEQGHLFKEMSVASGPLDPGTSPRLSVRAISGGGEDDDEDKTWLRGWMPVLAELFRIINSCKLDVRTRGLTVLFEIVKTYGHRFRARWWRDTFNLVFRVFQHVPASPGSSRQMSSGSSNDRSEWLNTTCNHTLYAVVDVFSQYYDALHTVLLDDLFAKLKWCCLQDFEQLARSGTSCIETVIISNGLKFKPVIWDKAVDLLIAVFEETTPRQLLTWKPTSSGDHRISQGENRLQTFASLLVRCVVQFELIQAVGNIVFYPAATRKEDAELWRLASQLAIHGPSKIQSGSASASTLSTAQDDPHADESAVAGRRRRSQRSGSSLSVTTTESAALDEQNLNHWGSEVPREGLYQSLTPCQLMRLVHCLVRSHDFAKRFNCDHEQRNLLWKAGFKGKAKPNLMKQETYSLSLALRILFRLVGDPRLESDPDVDLETVQSRLLLLSVECLHYYRYTILGGGSGGPGSDGSTTTESHREAWAPILVLLLSRLHDEAVLSDHPHFSQGGLYGRALWVPVCDLVTASSALPLQVRGLMRLFLLRCGRCLAGLDSDHDQQL